MEKRKKSEYFEVVGLEGNCLTLKMYLEAPSAENRSTGTTEEDEAGKVVRHKNGKSHVLGRAFGKLPFHAKGRPLKISAFITVPAEESVKAAVQEVEFA